MAIVLGLPPGVAPFDPAEDPASQEVGKVVVPKIGERVVFQVDWHPPWYLFFLPPMEAGNVELRVAGEVEYRNQKALQIVFEARSSGALARLAGVKVEDHFEFFTDPKTLCSLGVKKRQWEGKRKRDIEVEYFQRERRLHIREIDTGVTPPIVKKDRTVENLPECVMDVFSAFYAVRSRDFFPGAAHKAIVGDNDVVREVEVRVERRERLETLRGRSEAWRVNTVALLGGVFKEGGHFRMWLSADDQKLPLQFEAKVSLGTVRGKLRLASR